eukprot:1137279-Pelagomonas_calceolata.AAC.1
MPRLRQQGRHHEGSGLPAGQPAGRLGRVLALALPVSMSMLLSILESRLNCKSCLQREAWHADNKSAPACSGIKVSSTISGYCRENVITQK